MVVVVVVRWVSFRMLWCASLVVVVVVVVVVRWVSFRM